MYINTAQTVAISRLKAHGQELGWTPSRQPSQEPHQNMPTRKHSTLLLYASFWVVPSLLLVPVNSALPQKGDMKTNLTILAASRRDLPPILPWHREGSSWSQDFHRTTTATILPNDEGHKSTAIQTMHTLKHPVNQADLWSGKPAGIMSILWIHNVLKLPLCEVSPWFVWESSNAESTAASCCLSCISIIFG